VTIVPTDGTFVEGWRVEAQHRVHAKLWQLRLGIFSEIMGMVGAQERDCDWLAVSRWKQRAFRTRRQAMLARVHAHMNTAPLQFEGD
jgi:hypothetical protein